MLVEKAKLRLENCNGRLVPHQPAESWFMLSSLTPPQLLLFLFTEGLFGFCVLCCLSLLKSLRFLFKHQSVSILKSHCSILVFHAKYSNTCTAPGLFTVNCQCEPTTPLFSPISCTIRAASEALIQYVDMKTWLTT